MQIDKPGFYKTRDGRKAEVAGVNMSALANYAVVGWIDGAAHCWCDSGKRWLGAKEGGEDLVGEWREPAVVEAVRYLVRDKVSRKTFIWQHKPEPHDFYELIGSARVVLKEGEFAE